MSDLSCMYNFPKFSFEEEEDDYVLYESLKKFFEIHRIDTVCTWRVKFEFILQYIREHEETTLVKLYSIIYPNNKRVSRILFKDVFYNDYRGYRANMYKIFYMHIHKCFLIDDYGNIRLSCYGLFVYDQYIKGERSGIEKDEKKGLYI